MNNQGDMPSPQPLLGTHDDSDWDLIRRTGDGDHKAFERLYKRYYYYLFRFIYRTTRQLGLVEDIINEVMFAVWQKAGTLDPKSHASTWILSVAYKKSLKSLYSSQIRSNDVPFEEIAKSLPSDAGAMMKQLELEDLLWVALGLLSPEQRAVIELVYYHGMCYSDIAEVMRCPENTVKTRMFHARKKLRSLRPSLMGETDPPKQEQEQMQ
jgi:RNA polymerase sigma factor (sigma-70 family)